MDFRETLNVLLKNRLKNIRNVEILPSPVNSHIKHILSFCLGEKGARRIIMNFDFRAQLDSVMEYAGDRLVRETDYFTHIPSVKGIRTVKFAEDGTGTREFMEFDDTTSPQTVRIAKDRYDYNKYRRVAPMTYNHWNSSFRIFRGETSAF